MSYLQPLTDENVESELSYAYLHAVASKAAASCAISTRHEDNNGVDAKLTLWGDFPASYLTEVEINVQLKATTAAAEEHNGAFSYWLQGTKRYDKLREETVAVPRIIVVLFLPKLKDQWLSHSTDELILRRCAYWVSLRGAPAATSTTGVTVKLPTTQVFGPQALLDIAARIAKNDIPRYVP